MKTIKMKDKQKGIFSIDASFAVIILLTMSFLFYVFLEAADTSFKQLNTRQKTASLLVFSNEIVRNEATVKTNTESISNKISIESLNNYISYLNQLNSSPYNFNYMEISLCYRSGSCTKLFNKSYSNQTISAERICINRFIIIEGIQDQEGIMRICID